MKNSDPANPGREEPGRMDSLRESGECCDIIEVARQAVEEGTRGRLRGGDREGLTVSVGVAQFPCDGENAQDLLQAVDSLMYQAREEGKNRVYHRRQSTDAAI